jgi:rhodanese-related sulfurtransferase
MISRALPVNFPGWGIKTLPSAQTEINKIMGSRYEKLVADAKSKVIEISPEAAAQAVKGGAAIVDVREKEEWDEERIPGATHLSRGTVDWKIEEKFPDLNTPIICHCGGGGRSALVAESLQKMGYRNISSMAGGFKAWKAAGLPTEE